MTGAGFTVLILAALAAAGGTWGWVLFLELRARYQQLQLEFEVAEESAARNYERAREFERDAHDYAVCLNLVLGADEKETAS